MSVDLRTENKALLAAVHGLEHKLAIERRANRMLTVRLLDLFEERYPPDRRRISLRLLRPRRKRR